MGSCNAYADVKVEMRRKGGDILRATGVSGTLNSCASSVSARANALAMASGATYGYDRAKPQKSKRRLPHAIVYTGNYAACVDNAENNTLLKAVR